MGDGLPIIVSANVEVPDRLCDTCGHAEYDHRHNGPCLDRVIVGNAVRIEYTRPCSCELFVPEPLFGPYSGEPPYIFWPSASAVNLDDLEAFAARSRLSLWGRLRRPFRNWWTYQRYGKP